MSEPTRPTVPLVPPSTDADPSTSEGQGRRKRPVRWLIVGLVVVCALVAGVLIAVSGDQDEASPPPEEDVRPTDPPREIVLPPLGVYRGSAPDEVDAYEDWLGASIPYVLEFWGRESNWSKIDDPSWLVNLWSGSERSVVYSIAILPSDKYSLEDGAAGKYDDHWRKFGQGFVDGGEGDAILRLGWEFNGRFYPWAAGGKEDEFAEYWRRIVDVLRSIPGASFRFDWCPLAGNSGADVERAYPGDDYVDFIGLDAYDNSPVNSSDEDRWSDIRDREYGLEWHRQFAADHGKPMTFPEWGLTVRSGDNLGGGDNPYYLERMHEWLGTNDVAYAMYFEFSAQDAEHRLMVGDLTAGSETFRTLFGRG